METLTSMEEQLSELYREKEHLAQAFPGMDIKGVLELTRSVQTQLDSLISEQIDTLLEERSRLETALPGVSIDQVIEFALAEQFRRTGATNSGSDPVEQSFTAQLTELYRDREELETVFPGRSAFEIVSEVQEKIRLLEQFYAHKS